MISVDIGGVIAAIAAGLGWYAMLEVRSMRKRLFVMERMLVTALARSQSAPQPHTVDSGEATFL